MGRPKKALISRRETLEVALRIIDEEGLDALSIRRLGSELNVHGISLYHHFKNKDVILIGACELALANVRTPSTANIDWRDWLMGNAVEYLKALRAHPNLIPVLMRRHPLRIALAEHNATAGLLAVQGVPPGAIAPIIAGLEALALGFAAYDYAVAADTGDDEWEELHPVLFHVNQIAAVTWPRAFEVTAAGLIDAVLAEYHATGLVGQPRLR